MEARRFSTTGLSDGRRADPDGHPTVWIAWFLGSFGRRRITETDVWLVDL
jgi:hypothetical protein